MFSVVFCFLYVCCYAVTFTFVISCVELFAQLFEPLGNWFGWLVSFDHHNQSEEGKVKRDLLTLLICWCACVWCLWCWHIHEWQYLISWLHWGWFVMTIMIMVMMIGFMMTCLHFECPPWCRTLWTASPSHCRPCEPPSEEPLIKMFKIFNKYYIWCLQFFINILSGQVKGL